MRPAPGFWRDFGDLLVGHGGQPAQHVEQIAVRVQAAAATAFDHGVKDGPALTGSGFAYEKPVLIAQGRGPNGVFHLIF